MTERTEKQSFSEHPLRISLEGRERLDICGVTDVVSFDEVGAILKTTDGTLMIDGEALHVKTLDVEKGIVSVEGRINGLLFSDQGGKKSRKRLLR